MNEQIKVVVKTSDQDRVLIACENLNIALQTLAPLVRKMHLLSSNATCSAARAGSQGNAFRVLTQDIYFLSEEASTCLEASRLMMADIVLLASSLPSLTIPPDNDDAQSKITERGNDSALLYEQNKQLKYLLRQLNQALSPMEMLAKKGEYLAAFSSVEAAHCVENSLSFEAVALMLKKLVADLKQHAKHQKWLLKEVIESVEKRHIDLSLSKRPA